MVPAWLNQQIKRLAQILGIPQRYDNSTNFLYALQKAYKYTIATREDFERAIEKNPSELTNHIAYRDWLEEHDAHPDEIEFRNHIMDWHKAGHRLEPGSATHIHPHHVITNTVDRTTLPNGVSIDDMPYYAELVSGRFTPVNQRFGNIEDQDIPDYEERHIPVLSIHHSGIGPNRFRWQTYTDMEKAFLNAFKTRKNANRRAK
jgi:uncharacterized protein (TIGR02996 family)